MAGVRTVGVEEELLLVDPATGRLRARAGAVLRAEATRDATREDGDKGGPGGELVAELKQEQVETDTRPCAGAEELGAEIRRWRAGAAAAAARAGVRVAALATSPVPVDPTTTPQPRYEQMAVDYGLTAEEQLTCGCHVHVAVDSPDEAVGVLDRIRPWLPPLQAVTANSPFWQGRDTGYASYRSQVWDRWPTAGPAELFGDAAGYEAAVEQLLATGALLDRHMLYLDARPAEEHPTVEVRVADVCLEADDAVLHALLVRGLVETEARAWAAGASPPPVRTETLRLARWRAGRSGLGGDLVHPVTGRPAPVGDVLDALLAHVADTLADSGDTEVVADLLAAARARGGGAGRQRAALARTGDLAGVVLDAVGRTTPQ
ncbi:carboxylate-amine ligase [Pseudokineococcus sp. 1T1Z-3]|uniref:carboxylate-amine ligase n=1 Tax=Pseudokineococcus sp. 1T1Z-3 TaxID=3132745 RepID=UPI00309B964E